MHLDSVVQAFIVFVWIVTYNKVTFELTYIFSMLVHLC